MPDENAKAVQIAVAQVEIDYIKAALERIETVMTRNVANDEEVHKALDRRLNAVEPVVIAVTWLGGLLGAAIVLLVWGMVTGQVQVIFR